jgi:DNA-binding NarL/FixJ family response regulator
MKNVVVLSSIPALRAGLRALIAADPDFAVTATGSLLEGMALPTDTHVLVITQDTLTDRFGRSNKLPADVAVLVIVDGVLELRELAGAGLAVPGESRPWGILSAEAPAEALQAAVRALAEGLVVASPELLQTMLSPGMLDLRAALAEEEETVGEHLTEREIDVLREVARGFTNKQIALALGISEHTVKFHISSVYTKLGVSNRTEAVRKGARRGLIPL